MTALEALLVALGAGVGAVLRLLLSARFDHRARAGTLAANTLGSGVIGVAAGLGVSSAAWALVAVGFCGALTTWSAMAVQSVDEGWRRGSLLALATLVLAVAAAWAGHALAR